MMGNERGGGKSCQGSLSSRARDIWRPHTRSNRSLRQQLGRASERSPFFNLDLGSRATSWLQPRLRVHPTVWWRCWLPAPQLHAALRSSPTTRQQASRLWVRNVACACSVVLPPVGRLGKHGQTSRSGGRVRARMRQVLYQYSAWASQGAGLGFLEAQDAMEPKA